MYWMGVDTLGDMDFMNWYYEKYGRIERVVSFEVYPEYLEYKRVEREKFLNFCGWLVAIVFTGVYVLLILRFVFHLV